MSFTALFIDTNILLHYQSFDEIDWLSILNVEQVEIRLPSIVIQELDKHKYSSSSKLRDKATKVIKKLHKLADSGLKIKFKTNIDICFEVNSKVADFTALNLDPKSQDDSLLLSILSFRDENPDLPVTLVAADLGLRLKAKYYQIKAICLPDDLKLPAELDQSEKRIKELEQEVLELKRRTPDLKLYFSGGSGRLNCEIKKLFPPDVNLNVALQKCIDQLKQEHPKIPEIESGNQATNFRNITSMNIDQMYGGDTPEILPSEISAYNKNLDKFYTDYECFLDKYFHWLEVRYRSVLLEISIFNVGTCPAEDIDVFMHFPDGFILRKLADFPESPKELKPPSQPVPKTRKDRLSLMTPSLAISTLPQISPFLNSQPRVQPNISSPDIRRSNSYDVELHVRKLKQNISESFARMSITFDSFEHASSFQIDYRIVAANVPKLITGALHVIVDRKIEG
jgi:hypothetical protein